MEDFSIIISCGGTGGHFYPGLSLAREFDKQGAQVRLFVAGRHGPEQKKQAANFNLPADCAKAIRMPTNKLMLPLFALVFSWTTLRSIFYLLKHKPKAVLVMGSFASVPLGLATVITGTPLFLHEGNTVVGKANRLLSKWAQRLYLSFPAINEGSVQCKTEISGMPIRPELTECNQTEDNSEIKARLGFEKNQPLLLVFGGSQGAQRINENLYKSLPQIGKSFQLFHLTGQDDNSSFVELAKSAGVQAKIEKSTSNMADAIRAADMVVCRAGASSLAELAWFGQSALFIPLKIAAENHQFHNAELAQKISAGEILEEDDLSPESLTVVFNKWLTDKEPWEEMSRNMTQLAQKDVSQTIVKSIATSC